MSRSGITRFQVPPGEYTVGYVFAEDFELRSRVSHSGLNAVARAGHCNHNDSCAKQTDTRWLSSTVGAHQMAPLHSRHKAVIPFQQQAHTGSQIILPRFVPTSSICCSTAGVYAVSTWSTFHTPVTITVQPGR